MKVLFLDIDGVVNSRTTLAKYHGLYGIDPSMAVRVKSIIKETGCEVILSSTWRLNEESREEVRKKVCKFADITPDLRGTTDRGCEVIAWLKDHPEVERHAILDDNSDFHGDQPLFKTTWERGLTPEIAADVINYLNAPVPV